MVSPQWRVYHPFTDLNLYGRILCTMYTVFGSWSMHKKGKIRRDTNITEFGFVCFGANPSLNNLFCNT